MTPNIAEQEQSERLSDNEWQVSNTTTGFPDRATLSAARVPQHIFRFSFDGRRLEVGVVGDLPGWVVSAVQSIGELLRLEPDWDTYGGSPINPRIVGTAIGLLVEFTEDIPTPSVVPTSRGGLQLEWHTCGIDLEVEFLSATRIHGLFDDAIDKTSWEKDLSSDLSPLVEAISKLSERR